MQTARCRSCEWIVRKTVFVIENMSAIIRATGTAIANRSALGRFQLDRRILPAFGSKRLDRISPAAVRRWFDRRSRTAPGNASHGLSLFRQIMNFAVACGHVKSNPARGNKT